MKERGLVEQSPQEGGVFRRFGQGLGEPHLDAQLPPNGGSHRAPAHEVLPRLFAQTAEVARLVGLVRQPQGLQEPGVLGRWPQSSADRVFWMQEGGRDVERAQEGVHMRRRQDDLAVVHVPDVPAPATGFRKHRTRRMLPSRRGGQHRPILVAAVFNLLICYLQLTRSSD